MRDARDRLAEHLGVVATYRDATGARHDLSTGTRDAMLAAMDAPTDADGAAARLAEIEAGGGTVPGWRVVDAAAPVTLDIPAGTAWRLTGEDGGLREGRGPDLGTPGLGIHALDLAAEGRRIWILSAPRTLPEPPRAWGVSVPLYGLSADGRLGTYRDLARAAVALGEAGADFIGINPVHAGFPTDPDAFSPYAPSHRGRLSAMHAAPDREPPLPAQDLLDWQRALPHRLAALRADDAAETGEAAPPASGAADAGDDTDLHHFAVHQALSERFGPYWTGWPEPFRDPRSAAVRRFATEEAAAVRRHVRMQRRAARQLAEAQEAALGAGMRFGLYLDLAVGTHPHGAETWGQRDLFATGVSLGAPPDAFSAQGQSWGLAPLRPDTLAREGFRPLARILRRALAHAKLLRIDHILGFERAFWVPEAPDVPGAYVAMPRDALLAVARIEAARAGATIVGEDLGNIPEGLSAALEDSGVLGCRVTQFEQDWDAADSTFRPAADYARAALTSWGSHDLPTWEGWKSGRDIDWRERLGDLDAEAAAAAQSRRAAEVAALTARLGGDDLDALHRFLAATPSRLVVCQIEDLLGRVEQPNLPGTIHAHPNWRRRVGLAPEALGRLDALRRTAIIMADAGRGAGATG